MVHFTDKARAFLARKPALIGIIAGVRFYEHPTYGDEAPLIAIAGGKLRRTDCWELPELEDALALL